MKKTVYLLIALSFVIGITLGSSTNVIAQQTSIPSWVKNTALWWGQGQISDAQFIMALQWMINQGIITIPSTQSAPSSQQSSNAPTSTPVANALASILPTSTDMGTLWQISPTAVSSRFNVQSNPPITMPRNTIEQTFQKNSDIPPTTITIDIASYQGNGMSVSFENQATYTYDQIVADYKNQNQGTYSGASFAPTPVDSTESCYVYSISKMESTKIDMFCVKGAMIFVIDASGNDLNMINEVKSMTNVMLLKITSYANE